MFSGKNTRNNNSTGALAEKRAINYLVRRRLRLLEQNYHCRYGEIDCIMQHGEYVVFIEVRYRSRSDFGGALYSVDQHKQRKLIASAQHYMQHKGLANTPCRFDIITVTGNLRLPKIDWLRNAIVDGMS